MKSNLILLTNLIFFPFLSLLLTTVASKILGARVGRFHDADGAPLDKPCEIPGHSVVFQTLGAFLLWFGCKLMMIMF